jgi:hypothetical protein
VTIERTRYYTGQLLDESDLTQEQRYFREKARRHNRLLHGWGVVCGLHVRPGSAGSTLTVEPGYALDPHGDEILVEHEVTVELFSEDRHGNAVSPCPDADEGRRVRKKRSPGRPLYLAIRYAECATRPVPVGETREFSRIRESFVVKVLTELPPRDHRRRPSRSPASHPCPESPAEPWVILAEIALGANLKVSKVDCHIQRRVGTTRP